jgi:hypothetical protein
MNKRLLYTWYYRKSDKNIFENYRKSDKCLRMLKIFSIFAS